MAANSKNFLKLLIVFAFCSINSAVGQKLLHNARRRNGKVFSFVNVVQFPNDACNGSNGREGTCYTQNECLQRNGEVQGTCAEGFGSCCVVSLNCGGKSSENLTHLTLTATTSPPESCNYQICPLSENICRIKFDFTTFDIAQPLKEGIAPVAAVAQANPSVTSESTIGNCVLDSFVISSPSGVGSPEICGFNTNQHMVLDVLDGDTRCLGVSFSFGRDTTPVREYDIRVIQYECGNEIGGPPGCLQFFTANTGTIAFFNFPTASNNFLNAGNTVQNPTHLANQNYDICFRRASGQCAICFQPSVMAGAIQSFGLSAYGATAAETNAAAKGLVDECSQDYLLIPEATNVVANAVKQSTTVLAGKRNFCGRFLSTVARSAASEKVCTGQRPFTLTFVTDEGELLQNANALANQNKDELIQAPLGIIGFRLDYNQEPCP